MKCEYPNGAWWFALGVLILMILFGISSTMDYYDKKKELELYCEMVFLHRSNILEGWPEFKGKYENICK